MARLQDEQDQWDDLLEEIEQLKKEGLADLKNAHLPKQSYEEAADKIINVLGMLPVVEELVTQVEDFLAKPRSQYSQDRVAGLAAYIIDLVEGAIRQIVKHAIEQTVSEYKNPPPPPKEVIKEIYVEPPRPWYERLIDSFRDDEETRDIVIARMGMGLGAIAWLLLSYLVFGQVLHSYWWVWAFLIPILLVLCFTAGWLGRIVAFFIAVVAVVALF